MGLDLYQPLFERVLFPLWETKVRHRSTLEHLEFLHRSQWWSLDALETFQVQQLGALVAHARRSVPYYRQLFDAAGVSETSIRHLDDLAKVPLLTRDLAVRHAKERRSQEEPLPTITKTTGGSTGEPIVFGYDPGSEQWRQAVKYRGYGWAGYRLGARGLHYWGVLPAQQSQMKKLKIRMDRAIRRDWIMDCTLRSDANMQAVVEAIRSWQPNYMCCYTQAGADLARFINRHQLRTWKTLPVICGAERLFEHDRDALKAAFGNDVFETYGSREVMLMASECAAHEGLHTSMENLIVEILVEEPSGSWRRAEPGETGQVVVTDLHNFGMPFIRYVTGDRAIPENPGVCSCGRHLKRLRSIEGRVTETLLDGNGARVGGLIFSIIFTAISSTARQFQVVQHADRSITVRVIPTEQFDDTARSRILECCRQYLTGIPVRIETVTEIPATRAGKHRLVIVEQPPAASASA